MSADQVDVLADLTDLPFQNENFDAIICNHVLEHIPDDRRAMSELARVLRPGGRALMMHPVQRGRSPTKEDWALVTPAERRKAFGQADHVRLYGADFADRLSSAGFDVDVRQYIDEIEEAEPALIERHALRTPPNPMRDSDIYVCTRRNRSVEEP